MRAAIVSCGLLDTILPLVRNVGKHIEIDLYVYVYGRQHNGTVTSFSLEGIAEGLVDEETTSRLLGNELVAYAKDDQPNVRIRLYRYPSLKMLNQQNFRLHRRLAGILNRENYDIVHFNGYRGGLMLLYAMLDKKIGKVWTIHDPVQHSGEVKWQTKLGYSLFGRMNTHFILHNASQQPEFIREYGIPSERCHYVPFGPLEAFRVFKNGSITAEKPATVLFYGRISPYKGVEYLIEAGKMARKQVPNLKVIIAGKPNYSIDLEALKSDPGFEILDRYIENKELVKLIESSQLVVCPYTDATQSGVIMTSYAFGKPVLASAVGGIPEVVEEGKTGRLIPPRDSKALAAALVDMLGDKQKLQDMKQQLQLRCTEGELSWGNIAQRTQEIYRAASHKNAS